jgi:hypothetical protein
MSSSYSLPLIASLLFSCSLFGQGPVSGFLPKKGEIAIATNYAIDRYDRYFLPAGEEEARTLGIRSYNLFIEAATGNNTSIIATLPYLKVDAAANQSGLQDAGIWLKYANSQRVKKTGLHNLFTSIGLSFPVGNYSTGDPTSIGQRASVFSGRLVYQYQHNSGWFVSAISGIDFQLAPESQIAWPLLLRSGYGGPFFYIEGWLELVRALEVGTTARGSAVAGTGSSWNRIGTTLYFPITSWFGINVGGAWIVSGTYIGASNRYNIGTVFTLGRQ